MKKITSSMFILFLTQILTVKTYAAQQKSFFLAETNDYWNGSITYKDEGVRNNKKQDRWQTPEETFILKSGDCEDYAIAKYFHLIAQGVNAEKLNLALVLLKDPFNKEEGFKTHVVLLYEDNDKTWVLDNYSSEIVEIKYREDIIKIFVLLNNKPSVLQNNKIDGFILKWEEIRNNYEKHVSFSKKINK